MDTPRTVLVLLVGVLLTMSAQAQSSGSEDPSFDLLLAPSSPGFVLLGIEPASVERPGSVSDLTVSVLNQTDNLSVLPQDYALELAPFWLLAGENLTYEGYASNRLGANVLQSFSVSVATSAQSNNSTTSQSSSTALGVGIRFSPLRGTIDSTFNQYAEKLASLRAALREINNQIAPEVFARIQQNDKIRALDTLFFNAPDSVKPILASAIESQKAAIQDSIQQVVLAEKGAAGLKAQIDQAKQLASNLPFRRLGWKVDVAGGLAIDFPQQTFDDGTISRVGAWITGGYEGRQGSLLGVFRLMGDPNASEMGIDLGQRLIYDNGKRFSVSAEFVYRTFPNASNDAPGDAWRLAFLSSYTLAKNKTVSFSFGRNFEGVESGNLLAAVHLLLGLGTKRPLE